MAEHDYVRLAAACHCGEPVKLWSGRGRKPIYCQDHKPGAIAKPRPPKPELCTVDGCGKKNQARGLCAKHYHHSRGTAKPRPGKPPRPERSALVAKECPACRGFFTPSREGQKACSQLCRVRLNRGNKPRQQWACECRVCAQPFTSVSEHAMYCGRRCKHAGWVKANPERHSLLKQRERRPLPVLCAYWVGYCSACGTPMGGRRAKGACDACARASSLSARREAQNALNLAKHKARGKTVQCNHCGLIFCPLYGAKTTKTCQVCRPLTEREAHKAGKAKRHRRIRSAEKETVIRRKVFERDGWKCQLCGIDTPRSLMGTMEHNAPEHDHIVPVARGGAHTYANAQCLCRSCNGWKAARTMDEVLAALAA